MFYFALCFKLFDRLFLCYFQFPPLTFILEFYGFGKYRGKASGNVNVCVHCFSFPFASLLDREKFPNLKFNLLFESFFFVLPALPVWKCFSCFTEWELRNKGIIAEPFLLSCGEISMNFYCHLRTSSHWSLINHDGFQLCSNLWVDDLILIVSLNLIAYIGKETRVGFCR